MDSIIRHVSEKSTRQRLLSPKQFDLLVSSEGGALGRSAVSILDLRLMYSSLYVSYLDLCRTCEPSSRWTVASNIDFVAKASAFVSELEICIHKGVPRSKVVRDAIVLMTGVGEINAPSGTSADTRSPQDWDQILGTKFFDWVAYRASCVGNVVVGVSDEMYYSLNERCGEDLLSSARTLLLSPLSDLANVPGFEKDLRLARTCFSISHRLRSIFRGDSSRMRDVARVLEAVVGEWVVGQG
jgi:hypothetical protein